MQKYIQFLERKQKNQDQALEVALKELEQLKKERSSKLNKISVHGTTVKKSYSYGKLFMMKKQISKKSNKKRDGSEQSFSDTHSQITKTIT
jgi:hypothetical protein